MRNELTHFAWGSIRKFTAWQVQNKQEGNGPLIRDQKKAQKLQKEKKESVFLEAGWSMDHFLAA